MVHGRNFSWHLVGGFGSYWRLRAMDGLFEPDPTPTIGRDLVIIILEAIRVLKLEEGVPVVAWGWSRLLPS